MKAKWSRPFTVALGGLIIALILAACFGTQREPSETVAFAEHNTCELGVSDEDALTLIDQLIEAINELEANGSLNSGQANALRNHLENARKHIQAGRYCAALVQLNAFREQVGNFVEDGVLDPVEAEPLLGDANDVIIGWPNLVTINEPSAAAGVYGASGAAFGPEPTIDGVTGSVVLVDDGSGNPTLGCEPLLDFPAGAIALMDRGTCPFVTKALNAQNAGAVAVVVVNSTLGPPITMGGAADEVAIPIVMLSFDDGNTIRAGLPATGKVSR